MWQREQHDLPGRAPVDDAVLHRRRERVFLLLASVFVAAAATLPLLGIAKWFGVSGIVQRAGIEPPVMLLVPIGAFALPLALLAATLIIELYGRSRARAVVFATLLVWTGVLGLLWMTDHVRDYDQRTTTAFWIGVALAGSGLVTFVVQIDLFAWIGARWLRHLASTLFGVVAGWGAFALASTRLEIPGAPSGDELLGVALGAGGYTWLVVVVGTLPAVLLARLLAVYLRVELRRKPAGYDDDEPFEPAFVSKEKKPFQSDEMAFFDAGDNQR